MCIWKHRMTAMAWKDYISSSIQESLRIRSSPWYTRIWNVIFVVSSSFKVWNPAWAWGTIVLRRHVVVQNVEGCDWSSCCRCYPLVSSELLVWTLAKRNGALTGMPCLRKLWVIYFCCNGISCAIKMRKFHRCLFVFFQDNIHHWFLIV